MTWIWFDDDIVHTFCRGVDYSDTSNSSSSEDDKPHHRLKQKEYRSSSSIPMKDKKRARHSPSPVIAPPRMRNQGARPQALRPRRDPSSSSSSESSSDYSISPPRKGMLRGLLCAQICTGGM